MTLKRINKTVARRLVEASDEVNVIIAPVNIHPSTFRGLEGYANEILSARAFSDFDSFVQATPNDWAKEKGFGLAHKSLMCLQYGPEGIESTHYV